MANIHFVLVQFCAILLIFVHFSASNQFTDSTETSKNDEHENNREKINKQATTETIPENLYYTSTIKIDKTSSDKYWSSDKIFLVNDELSQSHRTAVTVLLSFDFPFYGYNVRNVTVTSGGFLHIPDDLNHSWLAATQYIAPLMMNFDGSLSNVTSVKYADNGSEFTVIWEKVPIQNKEKKALQFFTFSVTICESGDITFAYRVIPESIEALRREHEESHPLKIGLSDAYALEKRIFERIRKTIYEYNRVSFNASDITNDTLIYIKAKPTCLQHIDCQTCVNHSTETFNNFNCTWCPSVGRCSSGYDRKRSEWVDSRCLENSIADAKGCAVVIT